MLDKWNKQLIMQKNKTKKVAWFVSNCGASNNRLEIAHELQNYIQVDIYGSCGNMTCPRDIHTKCMEQLRKDYKFKMILDNNIFRQIAKHIKVSSSD